MDQHKQATGSASHASKTTTCRYDHDTDALVNSLKNSEPHNWSVG